MDHLKYDKSSLFISWMLQKEAKREIKWLIKIHRITLQPTQISFCYRIRRSTHDNRVNSLVTLHSTNRIKRTSLSSSSLWIKDAGKGRGLIKCTDCFQVNQHLWKARIICSPQTKTPCLWSAALTLIQVSTWIQSLLNLVITLKTANIKSLRVLISTSMVDHN